MTDHLHALAMRTKAADLIENGYDMPIARKYGPANRPSLNDECPHGQVMQDGCEECLRIAILALPLEADHAAILSEAVNIGEVRALLWAARHAISILSPHFNHASRGALETALKPFAALETP